MTESADTPESPRPPPRYTLDINADGSAVVKLRDPFVFQGETLTRLTIPCITGRHMRAATWNLFDRPTLGQTMEWANGVILPLGVVYELEATLARDLTAEVTFLLGGKYRLTGEGA